MSRPAGRRMTSSSTTTDSSSARGRYPRHGTKTDQGEHVMANPVTWFEIIGKDSLGLQKFYRDVFGWKMTPPVKEMGNYSMLDRPDAGIGGGLGESDARVSAYAEGAAPQRFVDKGPAPAGKLPTPVTTRTPPTNVAMLPDPA